MGRIWICRGSGEERAFQAGAWQEQRLSDRSEHRALEDGDR